jgi:cytochrome c-type biogenesis protein CcmH
MRFVCLALLLGAAVPAFAVAYEKAFDDPAMQARYEHINRELRCLVCQNQTIGDSNAELAVDLRRQVREQIAAGKTDGEIIDYMVTRYGDFVLYQPPVKATTLLLWGGPALLLLLGAFTMWRILQGRRRTVEEPPLSAEEHERAARLLGEPTGKERK